MSWDEYCSLVQSKRLALNIVSFRDQNISQGGESGRNQRTLSYFNHPSQVLLSNFVYENTPLTSVNPVAATNKNSAAGYLRNNASKYRQTHLDSSSIFPPRSSSSASSSSNYYMNIPRISCGGTCFAQGEWRSGGAGGVAANSSHYQLSTQDPTTCHQLRQPIVSSSVSLTAQMSGNGQASGSDNLSTIAGGRSSTSSDVPNSSSLTLTSNLDNSEDPSASAYDDYTADEDMSDYDEGTRPLAVKRNTRALQQREEKVVYNYRNIHLWLNFSKKKTKKTFWYEAATIFSVYKNVFFWYSLAFVVIYCVHPKNWFFWLNRFHFFWLSTNIIWHEKKEVV